MKKFEYTKLYAEFSLGAEELDVLGLKGWEMCGLVYNEFFDFIYYFKRELNEPNN